MVVIVLRFVFEEVVVGLVFGIFEVFVVVIWILLRVMLNFLVII